MPVILPVAEVDSAHDISVPSDVRTYPLVPAARALGSPDELPIIIFPLAMPAILSRVTALSAISSVFTALSAKCSLSIEAAT